MLRPSAHEDTFTRDALPAPETWPDLLLDGFDYPDRLNAGVELTDAMVGRGFGDRTALIGNGRRRTYKELADWTNRLANVLVEDLGVKPGNRVLIRSANNPAMVACWLAATKAGAVVVNTMPMLRAGELAKYVEAAQITHALCDTRLMDEITACAKASPVLETVVGFDGTANHDAELDRLALQKPVQFDAVQTAQDDVALIGFTSGSTGAPKGTMHFHRDLLIIADGYAREVLDVRPEDVFVGSPPLAFTFGLGGWRSSRCVSAGETLPAPVYEAWMKKTGKPMLDGIGATEMLHIFITNRFDDHRPACTGKPVTGYEAKIIGEDGADLPPGEVGRLAVRGPTGCRYLGGERQEDYVKDGWNISGDAFSMDAEGYFHFAARNDDMILSAGYNIAGPEVEAALLAHEAVAECAVVGAPDEARGHVVEAHVVLAPGHEASEALKKTLQDHVKAVIAPYKYPRSIVFREALPKTETGKIQRFRLREGM